MNPVVEKIATYWRCRDNWHSLSDAEKKDAIYHALCILRIMLEEMNCVRLVTPYHYEVSPKAHEAFKLAQEVQDAGKQKN